MDVYDVTAAASVAVLVLILLLAAVAGFRSRASCRYDDDEREWLP